MSLGPPQTTQCRPDTRFQNNGRAFFEACYQIEEALPGAMFGVSYAADGDGAFSYAVGVEVPSTEGPLPEGLCSLTLSAGRYAILRAFGPVTELPGVFDTLFSEMPTSHGLTLRAGAVFERYPEDSRNGPNGMAYEIWVPVAS